MERPRLTPEQRYNTEQQMIHDAELLRGGAYVHELGHLVVTEVQRERLYSEEADGDPVRAWLDQDVGVAIYALEGESKLQTSVKHALFRDGAVTFRQVLVRGTQGVKGIGPGGQGIIERLLQNDFGIEPKVRPSVNDIVQYCHDLSEVDAHAVCPRIKPDVSVRDVLGLPADQLLPLMTSGYDRSEQTKLKSAQAIVKRISGFAEAFVQAKKQNRT